MESPAQKPTSVIPTEPHFVRENWKRILGQDHCPRRVRYVRVRNKVATITDLRVCIRAPIEAADGFYTIDADNRLVRTQPSDLFQYPDVDLYLDREVESYCKLEKQVVGELTNWVEFARHNSRSIAFDQNGVSISRVPRPNESPEDAKPFVFHYPFNVRGEILLSPNTLKLALVEMLRYDAILVSRENPPGEETPLVFGLDWNRCALVMPQKWP